MLTHRRYSVREELGRGAQGVVLRVFDREQPELQLVAKLWRAGAFDAATARGEFELLRRLAVPGLVGAHDFAFDELTHAPFLVEDFVPGVEAASWVHAEPRARAERLSRVLMDTAITLGALHDAAFTHGDLKPAHVRLGSDERMMLLDLGAAVARSRESPGAFTPDFAAPEVRAGAPATASADLYALGALGWTIACGRPPNGQSSGLRALAPWVPPSLSQLIELLLSEHPRDRPASAEEVVRRLGSSGLPAASRGAPGPVGRERELVALTEPRAGVRYVSGASSTGKSQLVREVVTRVLASGRAARRVVFPSDDQRLIAQLIAFFRGASGAWPFTVPTASDDGMPLLVLDDLHAAPSELVAALDAFRCREAERFEVDVLATLREAPDGASGVVLGPLSEDAFATVCSALGVRTPDEVAALARMTERNPGFLVAARGRIPLSRDAAVERARSLSTGAVRQLASLALLGGVATGEQLWLAPPSSADSAASAELLAAALITRRHSEAHVIFALQVPALAHDVAGALGSFELAESLAALLLADPSAPARALLALAGGPFPPRERVLLLERAAEAARRDGLSGDELEALLALAAEPACRSRALVLRLERLTRSAGQTHPGVLEWLEQAATGDVTLLPLLRRRQAERAARAGDFDGAERLAQEALTAARSLGDRAAEALALGTCGAVALYRADVGRAEAALRDAALLLATTELDDAEELARLEHNAGVVALYANRTGDAKTALERSLALKRRLGDRAGVRACLLNLGLCLSRRAEYDVAAATLDEAIALARALRQPAGWAWCLAARADVEVRRGDSRAAERFIAEAEAITAAPPMVRADLTILRAQLALQVGDASTALAFVGQLDAALRSRDALLDARARLLEAGALLARLPAEPRRAARSCIALIRAARSGRLVEIEGQALELLRAARRERAKAAEPRYAAVMDEGSRELWSWLSQVADGAQSPEATLALLRWVRRATLAERALLVESDAQGVARAAWGIDSEDFELSSALERVDRDALRSAVESSEPLHQRAVAFSTGQGARVAVAHGDGTTWAVLLLEHRFRLGAFDRLDREQARRFATLCRLALRLHGSHAAQAPTESRPQPAEPGAAATGETTVLPFHRPRRSFPGIIGKSRALGLALAKLDAAIGSNLPVLILGESGTGKELFARALHELGDRSRAPLVTVNCAAIADSLFEAELFGHARGAFTGAERARPGLLARAEGGTLFLDEVGELPLARQASLLRVLESRRYRPVGSDEERSFDVHIVAATNRPLAEAVAQGQFRGDLLYRLNVVEIRVPALRERLEDVPLLVQSFLERARSNVAFSPAVMSALENHDWPGNVRELEHHVERLLALGVSRVERAHLPRALRRAAVEHASAPVSRIADPRAELEQALREAGGNITHAARALGLTRHGLKKRMLRLGLRTQAGGT